MRKTLSVIAGMGVLTQAVAMSLVAIKGGDGVAVSVDITNSVGTFKIASDNGKIKTFANMDEVFKILAKERLLNQVGGAVTYTFNNVSILEPKPYTGDVITKATKTRDTYILAKAKSISVRDALIATIALMPSVTQLEIDMVEEKTTQKEAVVELVAWYASEITRINAVLGV
jgi:hypothetical protein